MDTGTPERTHPAYAHLDDWIKDPLAVLASGAFSREARRHYRKFCTEWIDWTLASGGPGPYDAWRPLIGVWVSEAYEDSVRTRGAAVSAVKAMYARFLALGICDGIEKDKENTRRKLAGDVPGDPVKGGLTDRGALRFIQALERLRGADAARDRACGYLLLNQYLGGDKLRPHQVRGLRVEDRVFEQGRVTWKVPRKNASTEATTNGHLIARDVSRAVDDYLEHRVTCGQRGTGTTWGPLLTSHSKKTGGAGFAKSDPVFRIVAGIVASHDDLAPYRDTVTADFVAATPRGGVKHDTEENPQ